VEVEKGEVCELTEGLMRRLILGLMMCRALLSIEPSRRNAGNIESPAGRGLQGI
jgi:hypothetical protein